VADPEALAMVPQDFARRNRVLPIAYNLEEHSLTVATAEMFNIVALDQLRAALGSQIEIKTQLAAEAQLEDYIDQFYGYELSVDGILKEIETGEIDYESLPAGGDEYTQPMVRLVNALLVDAVKRGASDIHFEPEYAFLRIRYRIDGVLETVRSLHKTYMAGITVRVKVVSNMNIAETRSPQDGRLSLTLNGRQVDFRVSTQPTVHGENLVLRVLDREKSIVALDRMNLAKPVLDKLNLMLARPEGILIVTGPTGSGKTTTLYSLLAQVNDETVNIMTLEDPVEYPVTLMRQTSVSEVARMDFANGIRSIMRQDPDIILVGEVRDKETAEMAFRAAMTGHQVFTTLHTNSALGAFPRLLDIGIQPDIMAGNIIGIVAQRLVRVLCTHCKEAYAPSPEERALLGNLTQSVTYLYRPVGCKQCDSKGYKGRTAIMELLLMDGDLDELVARRATAMELRNAAMAKGYQSLAHEGLLRVIEGITSLTEAARSVDLTGRYG
jgi:type II secretory ATPase GspE/PulE/Tfp pilus assembly ATPase PilB-like protein